MNGKDGFWSIDVKLANKRFLKRIVFSFFLISLLRVPLAYGELDHMLVSYSFDDLDTATGPDTFAIFQNAKGNVRLSKAFRTSGYRSIHLQEVEGDGDFAELQGYFPLQTSGHLYIHFNILFSNPDEEMNIALVGPKLFNLEKDGFAIWLRTQRGVLWTWSDSMPKRIVEPVRNTWYTVDAIYDIARGVTSLRLTELDTSKVVYENATLKNANSNPGSSVSMFSFIGDLRDKSSVSYYIDDFILSSSQLQELPPYIAPGKRKLWIDAWFDVQSLEKGKIVCIPPTDFRDLGISGEDAIDLKGNKLKRLEKVLLLNEETNYFDKNIIRAVSRWKEGCRLLQAGDSDGATDLFRQALDLNPRARMFKLSLAMAQGAGGNFQDAEKLMTASADEWRGEPRFGVAIAMLLQAKGKIPEAADLLEPIVSPQIENEKTRGASSMGGELRVSDSIARQLPKEWDKTVQESFIREQYFFLLLWQGKYEDARVLADRLSESPGPRAYLWKERAGDACFLAGFFEEAEMRYRRSISGSGDGLEPEDLVRLFGKLSDLAWKRGDFQTEKSLREKIYGILEEE